MEHTKGPIHALYDTANELVLYENNDDEAALLAIVNTSPGSGRSHEECVANANHLAACWNALQEIKPEAVSDLLEVLKRIADAGVLFGTLQTDAEDAITNAGD